MSAHKYMDRICAAATAFCLLMSPPVEDSFLRRNYGRDCGEPYKPDSMSFGGGRGSGRDGGQAQPPEGFGLSLPDMGGMGSGGPGRKLPRRTIR